MRAMGTSSAASLDTGKGRGNHSFDACSWGISQAIYREGGRKREEDRASSSQRGMTASDQFRWCKEVTLRGDRQAQGC
jgi:hypothetical protein